MSDTVSVMPVARSFEPRDATVTLPAGFVLEPHPLPQPDARAIEYSRLRDELDHVLEKLLLHPPRHDQSGGPFAHEYERLAERRRVLTAEVSLLERQMGKKPRSMS